MNLQHCALFNGLSYDIGPCDVLGVPVGLIALLFAVLAGSLIGRWMTS